MEKLIIIGWGRMGITHASIINGLYPNKYDTIIVEPNRKVRLITRQTFGYKVVKDISDISLLNAKVLITTPPIMHKDLTDIALRCGANSVFVEKPFGLFDKRVSDDPRITIGYVLRFTEIAQELKNIISAEGCVRIQLDYSSHTLTKPPKGWRNSIHGGVLNEMGSHLIDLMLYLGGEHNFKIESSFVKSVISDVDDIVSVKGTLGNIKVELSLNWVNSNYRKPIWSGSIETNNRILQFDQQSIDGGFDAARVDYYVRGRDFSLQMKHFIENDKTIICDSLQANKVHDVIMKIKGQS
jgi:predicted dehydrogenase